MPSSWEGDRNDLALDATRTYPDRFAAWATVSAHGSAGPYDTLTRIHQGRPALATR